MRTKRQIISAARRRRTGYTWMHIDAYECKDMRYKLDTLPPEILGIILRMLPLHDVACTVRLVSKHCSEIAATILNSEFLVAGNRLEVAMKRVMDFLNNVKADTEALGWSRIFNTLELIQSQYRMLKAVTWRYTHSRSALVSGCKIVDVLDCLGEGRQLLSFRISPRTRNSMISMQLRYVLRRTWFTCLQVPNMNNEHCWRDKQRYMYLRLRRLVGSFNKHLFHKLHYERKLVLRAAASSLPPRKPPPASTYSGYGEYGGQFFYYGNMSKYAYENRFKHVRTGNVVNTSGELEETNKPSQFDLVIGVELRCSPELAPLAVRTNLKSDDLENSGRTNSRQELYLKLSTKCAASKANRLPSGFTWLVRGPRRNHSQCR